ncbi:MAG: transposase [FCB group bacterium]|nr:transposase [FCB group bacterium]
MFKEFDRDQSDLLPQNLRDLIPENDIVFMIAELIDILDLGPLYKNYSNLGQNGYHPGMLLAVLFYAYSKGIFASRKIAEMIKFDIRGMYLAGKQTPDFHTIADFRKNNLILFNHYFRMILKICAAAGLLKTNEFAIDGSKIRASASPKQSKERSKLEKELAELDQRIDQILEQAEKTMFDEENREDSYIVSSIDNKLRDTLKQREKLLKLKEQFEADPELNKSIPPIPTAELNSISDRATMFK